MRPLVILTVAATLVVSGCARPAGSSPSGTASKSRAAQKTAHSRQNPAAIAHTLDRFTFGARPATRAQIEAIGLDGWFRAQLQAKAKPQALVDDADDSSMMMRDDDALIGAVGKKKVNFKKLSKAMQMAQLRRHVQSDQQLLEVMTDFWTNHFNVFARKGQVKFYAHDFVETAIRPNALSNFEDLLVATARHPAMLFYLDNVRSRVTKKRDRINENYARELLELHTVGVKGGYTQDDVIAVARVLSGWSARRANKGNPGFVFRRKFHDKNPKTVMGKVYDAGGEQEGLQLLAFLAAHPSTGKHLATKLCARFVSDEPPRSCVDAVAKAHREHGGSIGKMLQAIFDDDTFWDPRHQKTKLKTPLEFLSSAIRVLDGEASDSNKLATVLARLGQPLLMQPVPTGYAEDEKSWTSSAGMLQRMNLAAALGRGKLPGARIDLDRVIPLDSPDLVQRVNEVVLAGQGSAKTLSVIRAEVDGVKRAKHARAIALTLALGSPDFQRQ